jgi:hypothetical protein
MNRKTCMAGLLLLLAASLPLGSCGFRYMPKPKVIVEGTDPQVSFYASVLALGKLGYGIQAVDEAARTIVTEPRSGGGYWWQLQIAVAANGHVAIDTRSDLEIQQGDQTLAHKGIVNRSIDLSKHIRNIIAKVPAEKIVVDGSSLLPSMIVTPETQLVIPGT